MNTQTQNPRPLTEVKPSPGKGLGLFAKVALPRGTRIIAEAALLPDTHGAPRPIVTTFLHLTSSQRNAYLALHSYASPYAVKCYEEWISMPWGDFPPHIRKVLGIFSANHFDEGVFLEASRINHSCVPNMVHCYDGETKTMTVHVMRDVEAGEELTISYCGGCIHAWSERREFLLHYGFECTCEACEEVDGGKKPDVRQAWVDSEEQLQLGVEGENWAQVQKHGVSLAGILESEGFFDGSLSFLYHEIARSYFKLNDFKSALVWMQKKVELDRILVGDDHPQYQFLGRVVQCLKTAVETSGPPSDILLGWADLNQE